MCVQNSGLNDQPSKQGTTNVYALHVFGMLFCISERLELRKHVNMSFSCLE